VLNSEDFKKLGKALRVSHPTSLPVVQSIAAAPYSVCTPRPADDISASRRHHGLGRCKPFQWEYHPRKMSQPKSPASAPPDVLCLAGARVKGQGLMPALLWMRAQLQNTAVAHRTLPDTGQPVRSDVNGLDTISQDIHQFRGNQGFGRLIVKIDRTTIT
jgi:hypothetical protein